MTLPSKIHIVPDPLFLLVSKPEYLTPTDPGCSFARRRARMAAHLAGTNYPDLSSEAPSCNLRFAMLTSLGLGRCSVTTQRDRGSSARLPA